MLSNALAAAMAPSTAAAASAPARAAETPWILLVDDDELALSQLRQVLEHQGLRCVPVLTGIEALVYCDRHRPHLIVTDLTMPELDGGVLARWLKARFPNVPIVVVTGQDRTDPALEALRGTAAAILTKPVDLDGLIELLRRLVPAPERRDDPLGLP